MEILSHFVREFIQPIYMVKRSLTPHWNQNGVPCVIKYLIFWYTENLPAQGQKRGARFFIFKYDLVRDFFWYVNYSAKTDMENHYTSVGEWKWYWPLVLVPVGSNPGASNKCLNVLFIAITKNFEFLCMTFHHTSIANYFVVLWFFCWTSPPRIFFYALVKPICHQFYWTPNQKIVWNL